MGIAEQSRVGEYLVPLQQALSGAADREQTPFRPARKVLFLIDMLMAKGGAEGALLKMVTHLPRYGYACSIGTFEVAPDPAFVNSFPCPVHVFPVRRVYDWQGIQAIRQLRRLVARERFDIIHTMFPSSDLWAGPLARLGSKARLVSGRRDLGIVRSSKHDLAYRWLGRGFDQVQAVCEAARLACIERDGLAPERVFTVHNGVETERLRAIPPHSDLGGAFGLNPRGLTVVTSSGTLWNFKGVDVLIRAAALVCREIPDTNFLIAGWANNDYGKEMRELIQSLGLQNNVKLIGRVPGIISILKSSDLFCLFSRSEGMSNAALEAMACGLPCVATEVGGNPELIEHGKTGFLVKNEDVSQAAARILQLLRHPDLRASMGRSGRARAEEQFSVDAMISRVSALYGDLLR